MPENPQSNALDLRPMLDFVQGNLLTLVNNQRLQAKDLDYVEFVLPTDMPALPENRNLIQQQLQGKPPLSLLELEWAFERIADDERVQGVILYLQGFEMALADLQTLRDTIGRLRAKGKRVVCWSKNYDIATYFVASAADEIVQQPGGYFLPTGLVLQQNYLREALDTVGLEIDVINSTPYKSAADLFMRTEPSEEVAAMINWLQDSRYETMLNGIAAGRGVDADAVRAMIDQAPLTDQQAHEAGYVDALVLEKDLAAHLGIEHIQLWEKANNMVILKAQKRIGQYVAVLPVSGMIVDGESQNPPVDVPLPFLGGERMGDLTVVRQVRNLMQDDDCAAVVFWIDSGGGSATASEAMAAALEELAKTRPMVACMNGVAASGGYYISTPADWVVAQSGTITGSIGVIFSKFITTETLRKLRFNPFYFLRGKNADLFLPRDRFTDEQREQIRQYIDRIYEQFVGRVSDARKMKYDQVDAIGGGRVWTGAQALENGLVDQLGGLQEAIAKARELAKLPADTPYRLMRKPGKPLPAQLAEKADPAASVKYWRDSLDHITSGAQMLLPFTLK